VWVGKVECGVNRRGDSGRVGDGVRVRDGEEGMNE